MEPRRKEWAAAALASMCSNRLYHPLALLGVLIFLRVTQGSAAARLHPGLLSPALTGSKFRGRADRKLPDKLAFVTPPMSITHQSLIAGAIILEPGEQAA